MKRKLEVKKALLHKESGNRFPLRGDFDFLNHSGSYWSQTGFYDDKITGVTIFWKINWREFMT